MFNTSTEVLQRPSLRADEKILITQNRIPKDFFITTGIGQSDVTIHAGSYHLALKDAGIERCNVIVYSSILPAIANEVQMPNDLVHGSVLETIMAVANAEKGKRATAGLKFGWLYDKFTGKKYGGLVCEYSGDLPEDRAKEVLSRSLNELYTNGFSDNYILEDVKTITKSIVPFKRFGTAMIALCFVNFVHPLVKY